MRDTTRRYVVILWSLTQLYRPTPQGHQRQRLLTMALMISGVIGAQHCQLPQVIRHTPGRKASDGSTEQRFRRWLQNPYVTHQCWMLSVAQALLTQLSSQPLQLVIDGSVVGQGCIALMVSVVYRKRALPLVWLVNATFGKIDLTLNKPGITFPNVPTHLLCGTVTQVVQRNVREGSSDLEQTRRHLPERSGAPSLQHCYPCGAAQRSGR